MDVDQSGFIDFDEFANFFINSTSILLREDQITELFHALDPAAEGVTIHQFATQVTALIVPEGTDGDHDIAQLAKGKWADIAEKIKNQYADHNHVVCDDDQIV